MILFAVALLTFALQLAIATYCFRLLTCFLYRRLFVVTAQFHLAEQTFTLHLFLERAQCLIDVIIAYDDLYDGNHPFPNQISDDGCFPSGGLLCNTAHR